ncbi:UTRA domain-containing protein [Labrenzia sp. CE80]|uniref:UTRA domain-containing protein n=1 Tax=Labrenzia sp. CE80 TaxID=1788986 RepID=UPI001AD9302F|nr:UTRA domain-containing protein [Labrenzia sp. CE80]
MNEPDTNTWQGIQEEVLRRIRDRIWQPGTRIPKEMDLAKEFGCSRTTVNRALRELAESGVLERKRRSGTRVALHPIARTVIDVQIVRREIEDRGAVYGYGLIKREIKVPPHAITFAMELPQGEEMLHLMAVHLADGAPYALEDRWVSLTTVPEAVEVDFAKQSANEWLLENVPFNRAMLTILASSATDFEQEFLAAAPGASVLQMERATWCDGGSVTFVTLSYQTGHRIISSTTG